MQFSTKAFQLNNDLNLEDIEFNISIVNTQKRVWETVNIKIKTEILEQLLDGKKHLLLHISGECNNTYFHTFILNILNNIFESMDFNKNENSIYAINPEYVGFTKVLGKNTTIQEQNKVKEKALKIHDSIKANIKQQLNFQLSVRNKQFT